MPVPNIGGRCACALCSRGFGRSHGEPIEELWHADWFGTPTKGLLGEIAAIELAVEEEKSGADALITY